MNYLNFLDTVRINNKNKVKYGYSYILEFENASYWFLRRPTGGRLIVNKRTLWFEH